MNENTRIKNIYRKRNETGREDKYSLKYRAGLYAYHDRVRVLRDLLDEADILWRLEEYSLLEVGCGTGSWLPVWNEFGIEQNNIYGIELIEDNIRIATKREPAANFMIADCLFTPLKNECLDVVFQATVFSSLLQSESRKKMADEMMRVCRKGGYIISYDFFVNNPRNPDVRGLSKNELKELFPGVSWIKIKRVTLVPPLARRIVDISWSAAVIVDTIIPLLRTHMMAIGVKG